MLTSIKNCETCVKAINTVLCRKSLKKIRVCQSGRVSSCQQRQVGVCEGVCECVGVEGEGKKQAAPIAYLAIPVYPREKN